MQTTPVLPQPAGTEISHEWRTSAIRPSAANPTSIEARSLARVWGKGDSSQTAVDHIDITISAGELVAIVGPSGSGKSTLGSLIAGLDRPSAGSIVVDGTRLDQLKEDDLAQWRAANVGIVFQNFHLIPTLTAAENVGLGMRFGRHRRRDRRSRVEEALRQVGLASKSKRLPSQLSGGEQQRVGIARAIVHRPHLIVADEPTGSLDTTSGHIVFELIAELNRCGTTIVFITHDPDLAAKADRVITMVDGSITNIERGSRR